MTQDSQALTPISPGGVLAEWAGTEWESDGTEDIAPSFPVIKIVQPTSGMPGAEKHVGEFYRSDDETYYGTLDVVALFRKETRALFVQGDDQPICASNDGIVPRPNMRLWKPDFVPPEDLLEVVGEQGDPPLSCGGCLLSFWGEDGAPPPCKSSQNLLVHHEGSLAQLRVGGKSVKVLRQFIARRLVPKKLPLCSQRLHLFTKICNEPGRKWAELRIDSIALTPSEARPYNEVLRDERARFEASVVVEPEDEPERRAGNPPSWEDGSKSFRERIDPNTGEVEQLTEAQQVLARAAL